ncbi:hypothetical protein ACLMAB_28780 [Brevibacillus laterosporus]
MSTAQTPKGSLSEVTLASQYLGTTETLLIYTPLFIHRCILIQSYTLKMDGIT